MRKLFLTILTTLNLVIYAQEKNSGIQKSLLNVQAGFAGAWISGEFKLSNALALRAEAGIEPSWFIGGGTQWHPNFRLEPRYYYNLEKRLEKGSDISNNAGNFWALAVNYRPDAVLFSKDKSGLESYSFVPKWGIRRNISQHFNYETAIGFGFRHETNYGNFGEIDLHLRIGYTF